MARIADVRVQEIGNPHYDDPSLALLFMQLKDKSLQTVKGMTEISGRTEFNFVLQMSRVFTRMGRCPIQTSQSLLVPMTCSFAIGCHALALNLVAHWSFDRIIPPSRTPPPRDDVSAAVEELASRPEPAPRSPTTTRSSLGFHLARAPSLVIDMELPSLPATRAASPALQSQSSENAAGAMSLSTSTNITENPSSEPRRTGLGSLMKTAKKDVKVAEFDMDAFF